MGRSLVHPDEPPRTGGPMATTPGDHPTQADRSWQEIATELSHETNCDKVTDLATELNRALDKKDEKRRTGAAA